MTSPGSGSCPGRLNKPAWLKQRGQHMAKQFLEHFLHGQKGVLDYFLEVPFEFIL